MSAGVPWHRGLSDEAVRALCDFRERGSGSVSGELKHRRKRLDRPECIADTYRTTEKKIKYREHEGKLLPLENCICAISLHCPQKPEGEGDCRTLAPMPKPAHPSGWFVPGHLINTRISNRFDELVQEVADFGRMSNDLRGNTADRLGTHKDIRQWVSKMRCFSITRAILEKSKILKSISSFSLWVRNNDVSYDRAPEDLRADLTWLKTKWKKGDWDLSDPLRGINVASCGVSRRLNKDWKFYKPGWDHFGHNGLVVGESWRYQIAIMRDGGHGAIEGGVSGITRTGATSIVLSNPDARDEYADWDQGETIGYVSTSGLRGLPTRSTKLLLHTYEWYLITKMVNLEGNEAKKAKEDKWDDSFAGAVKDEVTDKKVKKEEIDDVLSKKTDGEMEDQKAKRDEEDEWVIVMDEEKKARKAKKEEEDEWVGIRMDQEMKDKKAKRIGKGQRYRDPTREDVKDRAVRVFRSSKLPPHNKWRPKHGFRYDGLYDVVDKEVLDKERELYRFTMIRRREQWPLRVDQPDSRTLLLWDQCAATQSAADRDKNYKSNPDS